MKTVLAILLVLAMPALRAQTAFDEDPEEVQLQQELAKKSEAYLQQHKSTIQKFTGLEQGSLADDPAQRPFFEDDGSVFEEEREGVEEDIDR